MSHEKSRSFILVAISCAACFPLVNVVIGSFTISRAALHKLAISGKHTLTELPYQSLPLSSHQNITGLPVARNCWVSRVLVRWLPPHAWQVFWENPTMMGYPLPGFLATLGKQMRWCHRSRPASVDDIHSQKQLTRTPTSSHYFSL